VTVTANKTEAPGREEAIYDRSQGCTLGAVIVNPLSQPLPT
jgi:hypothetical protein